MLSDIDEMTQRAIHYAQTEDGVKLRQQCLAAQQQEHKARAVVECLQSQQTQDTDPSELQKAQGELLAAQRAADVLGQEYNTKSGTNAVVLDRATNLPIRQVMEELQNQQDSAAAEYATGTRVTDTAGNHTDLAGAAHYGDTADGGVTH